MATAVIKVEGMTCNHCKASVEKALQNLPGVQKAEVNLAGKNVTVQYDEASVEVSRMKEAIREAGYQPQ